MTADEVNPLPKYSDMGTDDFNTLVADMENWKGYTLSEENIRDLKEVLSV